MAYFYENLWKHKLVKHEALRQAQLRMLTSSASPYKWGAFVLDGAWK